jgi:hypothetical protein
MKKMDKLGSVTGFTTATGALVAIDRSNIMVDYSDYMNFTPCAHRRVTTEFTGGRYFIEGEVYDDIQEKLVCLDCGEWVTEVEVRSARGELHHDLSDREDSSHGNK